MYRVRSYHHDSQEILSLSQNGSVLVVNVYAEEFTLEFALPLANLEERMEEAWEKVESTHLTTMVSKEYFKSTIRQFVREGNV